MWNGAYLGDRYTCGRLYFWQVLLEQIDRFIVTSNRPNILLLLPDQHRADWLGCVLGPVDTPHIDSLSSEGVIFNNAYTPSPLCGPARACLASGRNYRSCGVKSNSVNYPLEVPTYYQVLRNNGYFTAGVGKFDLHKDISPSNLFWEVDGSRLITEWGFSAGIDCEGKIDGVNSYKFHGKAMGPYLSFLQNQGCLDIYLKEHEFHHTHSNAYTTALSDYAYCDNWIADRGLDLLDSIPNNKPWHMAVNFVGPHDPLDITESMLSKSKNMVLPQPYNPNNSDKEYAERARRNYAAMIENIDSLIGGFIEKLKQRGEYNNTVIVYTSDHGEMLGDHGKWGKSTWRNPSVRIPLMIRDPYSIQGGLRSDALVSLQDLTATFLDFADCSELANMDSLSLRSLLDGRYSQHRDYLISELADWKLVFDGRHKLVQDKGSEDLLFDLNTDPYEDDNIASKRPDIIENLAGYWDNDNLS